MVLHHSVTSPPFSTSPSSSLPSTTYLPVLLALIAIPHQYQVDCCVMQSCHHLTTATSNPKCGTTVSPDQHWSQVSPGWSEPLGELGRGATCAMDAQQYLCSLFPLCSTWAATDQVSQFNKTGSSAYE
jgi:hypothetical protein